MMMLRLSAGDGGEVFSGLGKRLLKLGGVKLEENDWQDIGKIVVTSINSNIRGQKQADGAPLKRNAPSTVAAKAKRGVGSMSLVADFKRFLSKASEAWRITASEKSVTVEPGELTKGGDEPLRRLVRFVQEKGYTGWFSVNAAAVTKIRAVIRRRILAVLDGQRRGQ